MDSTTKNDARCCLYDSTHAQFYRSKYESGCTVDPSEVSLAAESKRHLQAVNIKHPTVQRTSMAKYSTGSGGGGGDGDACELCGNASNRLSKANVAGAKLLVCPDCSPHDDSRKDASRSRGSQSSSSSSSTSRPVNRKKRAAQKQAKIYDASKGDSTHWEKEGTNYERDRLPYLVTNYDERVETARQAAGLTIEELAETLGVDEDDYEAVEQGRASRAGVGGSLIRALEEELEIELVDE